MRLRRVASLLFVVPLLVACGGDSEPDDAAEEPTKSPTVSEDSGGGPDACSLISAEEVAQAVGAEVGEGVPSGTDGVVTGGSQTTCTWTGVADATSIATVTIYSDASAADSVRTDDSPPLPELGDDAFVGSFASVWGYAGEGSFFAQWYDFGGSDEENLPKSTALALLVRDAL